MEHPRRISLKGALLDIKFIGALIINHCLKVVTASIAPVAHKILSIVTPRTVKRAVGIEKIEHSGVVVHHPGTYDTIGADIRSVMGFSIDIPRYDSIECEANDDHHQNGGFALYPKHAFPIIDYKLIKLSIGGEGRGTL